ncbi:M48 family metallopeptidase [Methanobacterium alcaliphilum]|uniref:M48 family metallopeptidase n=1 Tax=Methanobacterium alcaliphilum TaxID=392018 RepID=UPI00200AB98B|nr:M48 family metallopeptidase [Methanobacterium alcaliphilum]MCK9151202.1 M48 family metalloprotease [Methanobacterium alcaliphilum]
MINPKNFTIQTEVSPAYHDQILDFIYKYYLFPQNDVFEDIKKNKFRGQNNLSFVFKDKNNITGTIEGRIWSGDEIKVSFNPQGDVSSDSLNQLAEDIFIVVQLFEENIRKSTIYFAWVEGQKIIPEKPPSVRKKASKRLFGSGMLLLYVLFFGVNIILFIFLGFYAVIFILLIQMVIVLLSDKIYMKMGDWKITPENPKVHIIQYQIPEKDFKFFRENFGENILFKIKKEIYDASLALGKSPTCDLGEEVLSKYGMHCIPSMRSSKVINVYEIIKKASELFDIPIPKIVVSNNMLPNAAATGPSPKRGLVLITTGLLVQLNEEEILSVIGHEMGHLKGRDPLILFSLISGEFILRLTILFPLVIISPLIYIFVAMGLIFFVAKFFEARADLLSAKVIGSPQVLAEALRKIGYQKLQFERMRSYKISSWALWDPHPPIYFRIKRLENLKNADKISSPLLKSAKDVINGFKDSFRS